MEGPEGSLLRRSGREGVLFGAGLGLFSTGWPTGPKRPGSTAPTSQGQFQPYFLPRPGPLFSQRHCPNSRHYYFIQVTLVLARRAGKKPGGDSED